MAIAPACAPRVDRKTLAVSFLLRVDYAIRAATSGALFNQQKPPLFGAIQRVYCIV
jgi:hypothetical protein